MSYLPPDAQALCDAVRRLTGVDYGFCYPDLKLRLQAISGSGERSAAEYLRLLERPDAEGRAMIEYLAAVPGTHGTFFRERSQLEYAASPAFLRTFAPQGAVPRVWSAGCGAGEEPFAFALLFENLHPAGAALPSIHATDISQAALAVAREGIYPNRTFSTSDRLRFGSALEAQGEDYRLSARIRRTVQFDRLNLLDAAQMRRQASFDLILCRNVLVYFDRRARRDVLRTLAQCLAPGGRLLTGHADAAIDLPELYERIDEDRCIYRLRDGAR